MKYQMGDYNQLEVLRETDYSYMLGEEGNEVFLHKKQIVGKIEPGQKIDVFLYFDNQKRVTATMRKPIVDQDTPAFVEVVDINFRLGAFLGVGLIKDLLLSRDDLPFTRDEWPKKGDQVFVKMKVSKNQLTAKIVPRYDIAKYLKPQEELVEGESYPAINVYKTEEGNVFMTEQGHYIFVYFKHMRKKYRLGEKTDVKISRVKGEFNYGGILIQQKEIMLDKDAAYIKEYLKNVGGEMPYTDRSDADEITAKFRMSKSAFKRAIGSLYKAKIITLDNDKTILIDVEEKE